MKYFTVIILFCFHISIVSQTQNPAIAFITLNSDQPKGFEVVALKEFELGTVLVFTDDAWIGSAQSFRGGEGELKLTVQRTIQKGEIISYSEEEPNGFLKTGKFNLSTTGDNIIVYTIHNNDTTFLSGIGWAKNKTNNWEYSSNAPTATSDLPPGINISDNTAFYLSNKDNYQLTDTINISANNYQSCLFNLDNYKENDQFPFTPFGRKQLFTAVTSLPEYIFCEDETIEIPAEISGFKTYSDSLFTSTEFTNIRKAGTYTYFINTIDNEFETGKITVNPSPKISITQTDKVITTFENQNCQWYHNGEFISEAIQIDIPETGGTVYAKLTAENGCSTFSSNIEIKSNETALAIPLKYEIQPEVSILNIYGKPIFRGSIHQFDYSPYKNTVLFIKHKEYIEKCLFK